MWPERTDALVGVRTDRNSLTRTGDLKYQPKWCRPSGASPTCPHYGSSLYVGETKYVLHKARECTREIHGYSRPELIFEFRLALFYLSCLDTFKTLVFDRQ